MKNNSLASLRDASLGRTMYSSLTASCRDASLTGCNRGGVTYATERGIPDGMPKVLFPIITRKKPDKYTIIM